MSHFEFFCDSNPLFPPWFLHMSWVLLSRSIVMGIYILKILNPEKIKMHHSNIHSINIQHNIWVFYKIVISKHCIFTVFHTKSNIPYWKPLFLRAPADSALLFLTVTNKSFIKMLTIQISRYNTSRLHRCYLELINRVYDSTADQE